MCHIISSKASSYNIPQSVSIAGKQYNDINEVFMKDLIDADNKRKQFYSLNGVDSSHVAYVENNRVVRSEELFNKPKTMKFGNKLYKNVTSKINLADTNYDTYVIESPSGYYNKVRVRPQTAAVIDFKEMSSKILMRKLVNPFKKLAKLFP